MFQALGRLLRMARLLGVSNKIGLTGYIKAYTLLIVTLVLVNR